jgi:hypothetical protein
MDGLDFIFKSTGFTQQGQSPGSQG